MQKSGKSVSQTNLIMKYIFKPNGDKLDFVGDFESLYRLQEDPWEQSGEAGDIRYYYEHSRKRLIEQLKLIEPNSLLEIGCGLGYTTNIIQNSLSSSNILGMDISETAINKASDKFPDLKFICGDIINLNNDLNKKFDVVILNQLLWYVLASLDDTIDNCFSLLAEDGKLIISQSFLQTPQKYGKDICDGFDGLIRYLSDRKLNIEYFQLDNSGSFVHNDGLIILKKSNDYE